VSIRKVKNRIGGKRIFWAAVVGGASAAVFIPIVTSVSLVFDPPLKFEQGYLVGLLGFAFLGLVFGSMLGLFIAAPIVFVFLRLGISNLSVFIIGGACLAISVLLVPDFELVSWKILLPTGVTGGLCGFVAWRELYSTRGFEPLKRSK
jgi:hypothetical protein